MANRGKTNKKQQKNKTYASIAIAKTATKPKKWNEIKKKSKPKRRKKRKKFNRYNDPTLNTFACKVTMGYIRRYCKYQIYIPNVLIVQISLFYTTKNIMVANIYDHLGNHLAKKEHNIVKMYINSTSLYFISTNNDLFVFGNTVYHSLGLETNKKLNNIVKHPYFSSKGIKLTSQSLASFYTFICTKDNEIYKLGRDAYQVSNVKDGEFLYRGITMNNSMFKGSVVQIKSGLNHTVFLDKKGYIYGIGSNWGNQLGIKPEIELDTINILNPNKYYNIKLIGCTTDDTYTLNKDNILRRLGDGDYGLPGKQYKNIYTFSCGVNIIGLIEIKNRKLIVYGSNNYGQCGVKFTLPGKPQIIKSIKHRVLKVQFGDTHTIVKTEANTYYAFGNNYNQQCLIQHLKGKIYVPTLIDINALKKKFKCPYNIFDIIPGTNESFVVMDIQ